MGADLLIDYTKQDYSQPGKTFGFVFDAVGKSSFGQAKRVLVKKGIYISTELGKGGENVWRALIGPITGGKRVLFPIPTITKEDVILFKELAEAGKFRPVLDSRKYSLQQIVEAYRYVETGQKTGNVVIRLV